MVNVILVDFRGFDTFGEITVLGIVALTVFALLRRFRPAQESVGLPEQQRIQDALDDEHEDRSLGDTLRDYMAVPSVIMRWMFPAIIMLSAYLFLRGHDLPGGGFAAGIALADRLPAAVPRHQRPRGRGPAAHPAGALDGPRPAGRGRRPAWAPGSSAIPFLTSHARYLELPLVGKVPFATALLFDLGVYLLVVGATVLILVAIAHQSLRSQPRRRRGPDGRRRAGRTADGGGARARDRRARRLGRLAAAAAAHLPGDHRARAALLRRQPLHLRDGPARASAPRRSSSKGGLVDAAAYADPVPQALVLTAIVISFATTALFLVVMIASRGLTGTDHVDGTEREP